MKLSVRWQHGLKRLLVGGLGTSTPQQASQGPGVVLYQLGENQVHVTHRAAPGACSMSGKLCGAGGGALCSDAWQRERGRPTSPRRRGPLPPTEHHLLTRLRTHEAAAAHRGCFLLICPPRKSTFFYLAQRCHIGQQHPGGQGWFERWRDESHHREQNRDAVTLHQLQA